MRFLSSLAVAVASLASIVTAQSATSTPASQSTTTPGVGTNAIFFPTAGTIVNAGDTVVVKWTADTSITSVSVFLRKNNGNPNDSDNLGPLATNIPNSGTFSWDVKKDLISGDDYAIQLTWGTTGSQYSTPFTIKSSATATPSDTSSITSTTGSVSSATASASSNLTITTSTRVSTTTTSSSPSGSSTGAPNPNNALNLASSPLALILGVVAAAVYLH